MFCQIFQQQVMAALTRANKRGLRFYRKAEIPVEYHIKESDRTAPILLVADKGYFLRGFSKGGKTKPVWDVIYSGHHGYDPFNTKEMRTIMYARGPGLKRGYTSKPLMMTDHYNLVCHLLDIEAQANNGSWLRVQGFLNDEPTNNRQRRNGSSANIPSFISSSLCSLLLSIILCIYWLEVRS